MRKEKYEQKKMLRSGISKAALAFLAVSLILCSVVGGTLAWLTDETEPVKNTFTYGDINIDLTETTGDNYKMVPGNTIAKDPLVTVKENSENCWLFVKIEESENAKFGDFMTYDVADGWTKLETGTADIVYYRSVDATGETPVTFGVLKDDQVKVKDDVTKAQLNALTTETYPTLTFTAYAVQRDAAIDAIDTAAEAWTLVTA